MKKEAASQTDGKVYPVEEYQRNEGSVGNKRIVFVGASYLFVHKVLRDMLLVGGFEDVELVVHDIDEVPMNIVADLLERIARQKHTNIKVHRTLDRKEALKDADAVCLAITTGGREADHRSAEVCAKYGIYVGVGDTLGPTALARCLREIPEVVAIAKDMEAICPDAVLLNFTNPMSCITGVVGRTTSVICWGLCHSADSVFDYFAKVFDCRKSELDITLAGVNHQSFAVKVVANGVDRTADILEASLASDAKFVDKLLGEHEEAVNLQQDIYRILGAWPSCAHTHLAEFYEYFYTPRRIDQLKLRSKRHQIIPGREPFGRKPCPEIIHKWTYGPEPVGDLDLLTTEHAHELLWSYFTETPYTRGLNVLNTGEFIKGLPRDACVEVMATVKGKDVTAPQVELPPAVHATVFNWVTIHDLSIKASLNCDRQAAKQALFLDPQVHDLYDIAPMLEDMIVALEPWLPRGWFA